MARPLDRRLLGPELRTWSLEFVDLYRPVTFFVPAALYTKVVNVHPVTPSISSDSAISTVDTVDAVLC